MSDGSFPLSEKSSSYYRVKYTILRLTKHILGRSPLEAENIGLRESRRISPIAMRSLRLDATEWSPKAPVASG